MVTKKYDETEVADGRELLDDVLGNVDDDVRDDGNLDDDGDLDELDDEAEEDDPAADDAEADDAEEEAEQPKTASKRAAKAKPPKAAKAKPPKAKQVEKQPGCYGVALDLMCANPTMTFQELRQKLEAKGLLNMASARTAHGTVRKVISLLNKHGHTVKGVRQ